MSKITIADYHCGNLRSVEQAFEFCDAEVEVTHDPIKVANAEKLVLPGVGAYPIGMQHLRELDLISPIKRKAEEEVPILEFALACNYC